MSILHFDITQVSVSAPHSESEHSLLLLFFVRQRPNTGAYPRAVPFGWKVEAGSPQTGPARSGYLFKHLCGIFVANSGD
jgi:hypothetical protein